MSADRILVYAQDAGGAQAIAPVVRRLLGKVPGSVSVLTHLYAEEIFEKAEIPAESLSKRVEEIPLTPKGARSLLEGLSPSLVFCTTSNNLQDASNGEIIRASAGMGIPCFSLMDHWKGWSRLHRGENDFAYLPDTLGVIDEAARERGALEGVPAERMEIVGHPHLEELANTGFSDPKKFRERGVIGGEGVFVCTLFTQPIGNGESLRPMLEGKRLHAVEKVVRILEKVMKTRGKETVFLVHPHPREVALFDAVYESLPFGRLGAETTSLDLARASNLIMGLNSMILYEAHFLGRTVLSLQLGAGAGFEDIPKDGPALLAEVRSLAELEYFLKKMDIDGCPSDTGRAAYALPSGAVEACEGILEKFLGKNFLVPKEARSFVR